MQIIERIAKAQSERPLEEILDYLSEREKLAYLKDPFRGSRYIGQAIHRSTFEAANKETAGSFEYFTKGPDFLYKKTWERIELTTQECLKEHEKRYPGVPTVIYDINNLRK